MPFLARHNATPYARQTRKLLEERYAAQAKRERAYAIKFVLRVLAGVAFATLVILAIGLR